ASISWLEPVWEVSEERFGCRSQRSEGSALESKLKPKRDSPSLFCPERQVFGEKRDRKSTRLNSSHQIISYAVFCLKKKKIKTRLSTFLQLLTATIVGLQAVRQQRGITRFRCHPVPRPLATTM